MIRLIVFIIRSLIIVSISTTQLLADFKKVTPGKIFSFPRDHGAHKDYPLEWWYFTGHLKTEENETLGFELTFFRVGVNSKNMKNANWHTDSFYLAHAALTIDRSKEFFFEKKSARPAFNRSGALSNRMKIWLDDWLVDQSEKDGKIKLQFNASDYKSGKNFSLNLKLSSLKDPVLQGQDGYSQKGSEEGDASYYVSLTRMIGEGFVKFSDSEKKVTASAWMDHEVLSSSPNDEEVGWDWFAIQLDNNYDCMIYHLRRGKVEKKVSPYSKGSCITPEGEKVDLALEDYEIIPLGTWQSKNTNITYPSKWRVKIKPLNLDLIIIPTVKPQELYSKDQPTRSYWEGRNTVSGKMGKKQVGGNAYVELVGYN